MDIVTLPNPVPGRGEVLVRTHFSAISAGTEGKTVSDARKGYIAKARSRQEEVSKVIKTAQSIGVVETYKMVMNKLEALQPLGYSTAGVVVEVGEGVSAFRPGERVACGGASASHSELTAVKENLVVKLPDTAPMDESAFTTIGAIALQGIRRADLKIGENCVVVGLGLIGQMTIRILKAAGVRVFGVDLRQELIDLAVQSGADGAALRSDEMLDGLVKTFSNGYGTDVVIITAGTASNDPVELAGTLCRHHGKVVIVGNVPTGFSRKTYYRKELELLMSTSYGPGRYDNNYEEKGLDYPIGQVRWTENRNMQAFVELLGSGKLSLKDLISHRFNFQDAKKAFDAILDSAVHTMGVLLEYDHERPLQTPEFPKRAKVRSGSVSFIGAGSFAGNFLLPHLSRLLPLESVLTSRPHTAEDARQKYSFVRACSELDSFLSDPSAAVAIATRHDTHALFAIRSLQAGKRVFVEKPLCLNMAEYAEIEALLQKPGTPDLMVGFNRRFAPLIQRLREKFKGLPVAINYRINAGMVPADHWVHDPEIGGGRIIGEACHFVDLCSFLAQSPVAFVSAHTLESSPQNRDTFAATLRFENGSVANISYFSNGNKALAKEHLEVFSGGVSAVMDDFKSLVNYGNKVEKHKLAKQDKGHAAEMDAFTKAVKSGGPFPISVQESLHAAKATFAIVESISQGGARVDVSSF